MISVDRAETFFGALGTCIPLAACWGTAERRVTRRDSARVRLWKSSAKCGPAQRLKDKRLKFHQAGTRCCRTA